MLTTWSQMQIVHKAAVVNTLSSCFVDSFILCLISPSLCVWQGGEKGEGRGGGEDNLGCWFSPSILLETESHLLFPAGCASPGHI